MLALTLQHPWPDAVRLLGKDIENRTWYPGIRLLKGDWFAIHGGKAPRSAEREDYFRRFRRLAVEHRPGFDLESFDHGTLFFQGIAAIARFGGCVAASESRWKDEGSVGWILERAWALPEPIPCGGAQGLWEVPPDALSEIRRQFRDAARSEREQQELSGR